MRNSLAWGLSLAALVVLAGCRTVPTAAPGISPWESRKPQLQARAQFELKGRVAVAAANQGFNARLRWSQDGGHAQVALEGPLGGGVHIDLTGTDLDILMPNGAHLTSDAAHAELTSRLGFDPPLASLRYWILGVPDPALPADETLDPVQQRLSSLAQDGWRIDYAGYVAVGNQWLPARLTLARADVRVKLLVDDWQS
jgi:outer membrane lipoprotein LolB